MRRLLTKTHFLAMNAPPSPPIRRVNANPAMIKHLLLDFGSFSSGTFSSSLSTSFSSTFLTFGMFSLVYCLISFYCLRFSRFAAAFCSACFTSSSAYCWARSSFYFSASIRAASAACSASRYSSSCLASSSSISLSYCL